MFATRSIGIRALSLFWQLIIVTLSFWGWLFIWQNSVFQESAGVQRYILYFEFLIIGVVFGFDRRERAEPGKDWLIANRKSLRQAFFGLFSVFLVVFALKDVGISRSFFFSYLPSLYASLLFSNYWLPLSIAQRAFSGEREERAALVGTLETADRIQPWLERKQLMGMRTVGLVCAEQAHAEASTLPILGTLDQIGDILRTKSITQLIVLNLSLGGERLREITQLCENAAVRLVVLHDLQPYFNHKTIVFEDDGVRFIGLREEPLESPLNRFVKRLLDLAVSIPVVLFILPFANLLVWFIHLFFSPGPLFFRQVRNGMLGRPFTIYKYRTMHVHDDSDGRQASRNDPRIFRGGSWLRRLSIDELPQFLNVLLGDMSVVGPRPHLPQHDEAFVKVTQNYFIRRFIRPGITGWAQVKGYRGEILSEMDIQQRVEADFHYLENWSFGLDVLIILKTAKHCFVPPDKAY
ncbi:MAG TPA: exopolysaccharide biosynthesis polyprenyl glycosylphosphotransferase [Verrucomicrobiae bacterium]|jgi:exopolysaccharide biosynthesis polyprenyl glycosylphosphotransferase|nr:exopolysaccharide biosynthesis polyprenyl glycosylphosphotransferase [Verrucomicrobiae bacterium]